MKKKIAAIIQARISSTRLPKKSMRKVLKKPLLEYMIKQVKKSKLINDIIIATSIKKENDIIRSFCKKKKIKCFSGSENNLVDRYCGAANFFGIDIIVRLTSDCPLIDPKVIDICVKKYLSKKYDFVANTNPPKKSTYPDGMDVEIFSYKILKFINSSCKNKFYLEHVTPYIWKKNKSYKLHLVKLNKDFSDLRLTVDYIEDFELVEKIITYFILNKKKINLKNIISYIKKNPSVYQINKIRNKKFNKFKYC